MCIYKNSFVGLNIFIVEDSPIFVAVLKRMLVLMGHCVTATAPSYDEAIAYLCNNKPDLVLTDIMLIGPQTGIDVAIYVNNNLQVPIIFQSSVIEHELIKQALDCSPVAFLRKPISKEALLEALSAVRLAG